MDFEFPYRNSETSPLQSPSTTDRRNYLKVKVSDSDISRTLHRTTSQISVLRSRSIRRSVRSNVSQRSSDIGGRGLKRTKAVKRRQGWLMSLKLMAVKLWNKLTKWRSIKRKQSFSRPKVLVRKQRSNIKNKDTIKHFTDQLTQQRTDEHNKIEAYLDHEANQVQLRIDSNNFKVDREPFIRGESGDLAKSLSPSPVTESMLQVIPAPGSTVYSDARSQFSFENKHIRSISTPTASELQLISKWRDYLLFVVSRRIAVNMAIAKDIEGTESSALGEILDDYSSDSMSDYTMTSQSSASTIRPPEEEYIEDVVDLRIKSSPQVINFSPSKSLSHNDTRLSKHLERYLAGIKYQELME